MSASVASTSRTKPLQLPLARRLLFPSLPQDAPYPPLFSSPAASAEITPEIYDFIALALRAYVTPWWSKLSRYDKEFVPEVNRVLIHAIQVLESRLIHLDWSLLLFRDIPVILTQHYRDYRNATSKLSTSYANGGSYSLPHLFHQLQPHMAISPTGKLNEDYYRHVIDQILRIVLPPEDYAPEAERYMTREIILKLILVDILPRITQPWFIQLAILNLLGSEQSHVGSYIPPVGPSSTSNSSQSLLILLLSTVQKLSGVSLTIIHAYKQTVSTIKSVNQLSTPKTQPPSFGQSNTRSPCGSPTVASFAAEEPSPSLPSRATPLPLLIFFSEAFNTAERLSAQIITATLYLLMVLWTSFLDRLIPHLLLTTLSPAFVLNVTRAAKRTLFPNGYPGPPAEDPPPEEQAIIRAKLIATRPTGALAYLLPLLLGSDLTATLDSALEPLCDNSCNLHLATIILDRILIGLFPELVNPDVNSRNNTNAA